MGAAASLIHSTLPDVQRWTGPPTAESLAPLPNIPAVLVFVDERDQPVQLLTTQQLKRLAQSRLSTPDEPQRGRADLTEVVRGVRYRRVSCPFEARWVYYQIARELHPHEYRKLVSFGPAWFLHVDWAQPIPELRLTERIWCTAGEFVGPWQTRKGGQQALEGLWDLFDLCRYPEQVRKTPHGNRCAYAEMGRCDAPCDGSVPLAAYVERCRAAWRFANGAVSAWLDRAQRDMQAAAADQAYERAAQLKQQIEFGRRWAVDWQPHVGPATALRYVLALAVTRRKARKLLLFVDGHLIDGPVVADRRIAKEVSPWLETVLAAPRSATGDVQRMEQTWLLCHLLAGRERASTIVLPFAPATDIDSLRQQLQTELEAMRGASESSDEKPDEGCD